jgi:ParB family protein of integrating conjugative element (PFGI_1 class)
MPRTPETLTAVQLARRLNIRPRKQPSEEFAADTSSSNNMIAKPPSKQEQKVMDQARRSLPPIHGPRTSATADLDPRREADGSFSVLPIDAIEFYRYNPRQENNNAKYAELKESIKADGITNMLMVTRRDSSSKYTPYGGGNTRLKIAKELFAEGDQRFATLKVVVKEWPGDAQVISAHLVENELRADITFWEKARGVDQFRIELAREQGRPLTAGEINRELKSRGLNYGVKMIQNFAFAIENLAPIGPWLGPLAVNNMIRPKLLTLLEIGTKLNAAKSLQEQLQQVMEAHAAVLKQRTELNEDLELSERAPVELDDAGLLADLQAAAAQHLGFEPAAFAAMLEAYAAQPNLTADALRAAARQGAAPAPRFDQGAGGAGTPFPEPGPRKPLGPATPPSIPPQGQQTPLPGMLSSVPALPQQTLPAALPQESNVNAAISVIYQHLGEINDAVPLHDVICSLPTMPFGYFMTLPAQDVAHHAKGEAIQPRLVPLRAALWKLLAALSYQYDRRVIDRVLTTINNAHDVAWFSALREGRQAFEQACASKAGMRVTGTNYALGMGDLALVLGADGIGYSIIKLLSAMEQMRLDFPDRMPEGFEPLFPEPGV